MVLGKERKSALLSQPMTLQSQKHNESRKRYRSYVHINCTDKLLSPCRPTLTLKYLLNSFSTHNRVPEKMVKTLDGISNRHIVCSWSAKSVTQLKIIEVFFNVLYGAELRFLTPSVLIFLHIPRQIASYHLLDITYHCSRR